MAKLNIYCEQEKINIWKESLDLQMLYRHLYIELEFIIQKALAFDKLNELPTFRVVISESSHNQSVSFRLNDIGEFGVFKNWHNTNEISKSMWNVWSRLNMLILQSQKKIA